MQLVLSLSIYSIAAGKSYHRHSPFADVNARLALLLVAVLIPVLALLGFAQGVREVRRSYPDPEWRAVNLQSLRRTVFWPRSATASSSASFPR